ncbi:IucA/IucC family protein [Streptomyces sp. NPDC052040]|uniref:IucA/IucC family protein n=1 Tax=Streptomyces sp. NPDC052040 TaxID=3365682 RepID=UPI0037D4401E
MNTTPTSPVSPPPAPPEPTLTETSNLPPAPTPFPHQPPPPERPPSPPEPPTPSAHPNAPAHADRPDRPAHSGPPAHLPTPEPSAPRESSDPLEHSDPYTAAQAATVENLLRCWVRETGLAVPAGAVLRIPLAASGAALDVPVHYRSATGWHRFGPPRLAGTPAWAPPVDAVTLAALLARETTASAPPATPAHSGDTVAPQAPQAPQAEGSGQAQAFGSSHAGDLARQVADSARRTALFIADRRARPADTADGFLSAEQALLLGHPTHPTAKSREGLTDAEARLYSPELRGAFPLHWFAVAPSVLATDSAWTERGRPVSALRLAERLGGPSLSLPDGFAALPLHPWQARDVLHRPAVGALLDTGLLRDLGPLGEPWHPTSSVRTVYRPGTSAMLKLSLGLPITNSRRENLRKELHRGVEVHRLLRGGLSEEWRAAHPGFDIVRDPAWLAVDQADGTPVPGLDVMIRHNPFTPAGHAYCVAGLVAPRCRTRTAGQQHPDHPSRLAEIIARLTGRTARPRDAVSTEWFLRYLAQVVRPVLWLDGEAGIALEAHQQNTVVLLDPEGWPAGGRYRDNQGYYFRASRRAELDARLTGIGEHSDTFVSDEVTDERFAYYLGINNVLGLIGAFGSQRLVDERLLLAAFRRFLADAATGPERLRTSLPARLLDSPVLRCKANLLTRLHGLDELVGPVDTQSVYITLTNPLHS